jgi:SAM-dependent methyltransferase
VPTLDPGRYYADLTAQYGRYAGRARGWHHGIWEPGVASREAALMRSNELLVRDLALGPASHVLDVGFGVGGFSVWAARTLRCRVTAISICADHVAPAEALAARHGVADRCRFVVMDMDELALPAAGFDAVINQETFCHAHDKSAYVAAVHRLLRPGGVWRAIDFFRHDAPLVGAELAAYGAVCEGFHIPSLVSPAETRLLLAGAGYDEIAVRDLTALTLRSADDIIGRCRLPLWLLRRHLDWIIFSREPGPRRNRQGHVRAAYAYGIGLKAGYFRHVYLSARRPDADGA